MKPPQIPKKINWDIDTYTRYLLRLKAQDEPTFKRALTPTYDLTRIFHQRLHTKLHGGINSHFVLYVRGLTGVDTGTGQLKSSLSIEIMRQYDPQAAVTHITWSNDELLESVQEYMKNRKKTAPSVFIRDETPATLKRRSLIEFETLKEAIRKAQVSLILVKPELEQPGSATFILEPMYHAKNLQYVKCALYVEGRGYIGHTTIKIHLNNTIWNEYTKHKEKYIQTVLDRQTNQFHHHELALAFIKTEYMQQCIENNKVNKIRIKKYMEIWKPNLTNQERAYVIDSIKELLSQNQLYELKKMDKPPTPDTQP